MAIKKVLYLAQQVEVINGASYKPYLPNVEIYTSLPTDHFEQSQAEQLKVTAGLSSVKSSIARLNPHYTAQQTEDEWLEIINEQTESNKQTFMNRGL